MIVPLYIWADVKRELYPAVAKLEHLPAGRRKKKGKLKSKQAIATAGACGGRGKCT